MSVQTHYFLAVRLPDSIKTTLNETKENIQLYFPFQRWVHQEDYHITLAFLGFAVENQLKDVKEFVQIQIQDEKSFSLTISELGTFGMNTSPRIFWAGLNESQPLQILREKIYISCKQAGFQLEKRPYHPHITLARKWIGEEEFNPDFLKLHNVFQEQPLTFHATDVVLYKTNLLQTPKYENLITFSLQS